MALARPLNTEGAAPEEAPAELAVRLAREAAAGGDWGRAEEILGGALAQRPRSYELLAALGAVRLSRGQVAAAASLLEQAVAVRPGAADAHLNLGVARAGCGDRPGAIAAARTACGLRPDWAEARLNLGNALRDAGCPRAAEHELRQAMALDPRQAAAANSLGALLLEQGRLDEAVTVLEACEQLGAGESLPAFNLGVALRRLGRLDEAEAALRRAIERRPMDARARLELALLLLSTGRWREGWLKYEWRFQGNGQSAVRAGRPQPLWDGGPRDGRSLLLCAEQGAGDSIQFVRFAWQLAAEGDVWIEAPDHLAELLATAPGVAGVVGPDEPCPQAELQLPMLSAPRALGATPRSLLRPRKYLRAPDASRESLERLLASRPGLRVGVVWSGDPANPMNPGRSVVPETFAPLAAVPGVVLWSLQFRDGDLAPSRLRQAGIHSLGAELGDFASTAGVVERLDLTISVDTSACHLAAALGRPVWTVLGRDPDWRWEAEGELSRWYPTMRLVRQSEPGNWDELMARVAADLRDLAG